MATQQVTVVTNKRKKLCKGLIEVADDFVCLDNEDGYKLINTVLKTEIANLEADSMSRLARQRALATTNPATG